MLMLSLLIIFICFSAFFSMTETALTTVSQHRIAHLVELKRPGAKSLKKLREDPAKLLSTVLIGNNLVNISASVLATTIISEMFFAMGMKAEGIITGSVIGIMTLFLLVFGEITPKTVAINRAEKLALVLAPVMLVIEWVLNPLAILMTLISRPFVILLGGRIPKRGTFITEEELKSLLFVSEKEGVIEKDEHEMISSIFKFGDLKVSQVMTPKEKMCYVENNATVGEAVVKVKESGHSRVPVIVQNVDNIVGVIYAKDLLSVPKNENISGHYRQALFIPGEKKVSDLLDQMQDEYKHLAIVVDEFGRTLGLVTLEDLIEEIVGEIHDEYERKK